MKQYIRHSRSIHRSGTRLRHHALRASVLAVCLVAAVGPIATAQLRDVKSLDGASAEQGQSPVLQQIDFEQKLDGQVPLEAEFTDETGQRVALRQYFKPDKPVVLALVYFECPMLCTEILNGTLRLLQEMDFTPGNQFTIVTISIDPGETSALAAEKKEEYLRRLGKGAQIGDGWHFLVGSKDQIDKVCDAVGYKYVYDANTDQYAHPSGLVVLTPSGKISHYFYGVQYKESDVRLGLVEASASKIGSPVDKLLLYCFHYDPSSGKYNLVVLNFVRLFGALTTVVLVGAIVFMLRRERTTTMKAGDSELSVQG